MANYTDWNNVLITYFTSNVQYGSKIYLSVDEDLIELLGQGFPNTHQENSLTNKFCNVVKSKVFKDKRIELDDLCGYDTNGYPKGVAFLSLMVLTANQMAEDEQLDQKNYFSRFRHILDLPKDGQPRPLGMRIVPSEEAPEAKLWETWNRWLLAQGFLPTAQRGDGGATKYINYPISQSLLRIVDKDRLRSLFREKGWQTQWDEQTLFAKVISEYSRLSHHIRKLIDDRQRHEALIEAIHNTYEQWLDTGSPTTQNNKIRVWSRKLFAGLYRIEDFLGNIEYYIYPKQQKGRQLDNLSVTRNQQQEKLHQDRIGWYLPIQGIVTQQELVQDRSYPVIPNNMITSLIFPQRDFWILIPDPDNLESGIYASWGVPTLGTQFIVLFKGSLFGDLQRLRDENLIEWQGDQDNRQEVFGENSDWWEIHQCQVKSQAWDGVFIQNQELKEALQPTVKLSISLSGGLRVPNMNAWVLDHPPKITVFGFYPAAEVKVYESSSNHTVYEQFHTTNIPFSVEFKVAGNYIICASCAGESTQRLVKFLEWQDIDMALRNSWGE